MRATLVLLYLGGIYTYIRLPFGEALALPATFAGLAGILLLLLNARQVRARHLRPLLVVVAVAAATIALAPEARQYLVARTKGLVFLVYSISISYGLFLELSRWSESLVRRLFLVIAVAILVGCALENYAGLRALSDAFRNAVFTTGVYDGDSRDMAFSGMIRPKLFTSEPSHVAKFFVLAATAWLALSRHPLRYVSYAALCSAGMLLIRSPIVLLSLPNGLLVAGLLEGRTLRSFPMKRLLYLVPLAIIGIALVIVALRTILATRFDLTLRGGEDSFSLRVIAPMWVAAKTLIWSPVWGAGISGNESIINNILESLVTLGINVERIAENFETKILNAFWLHWTYYGLLGGTMILAALRRFLTNIGTRYHLFAFLVMTVFSQTMGGPHAARFWSFMVIVFVTCHHVTRARLAAAGRRSFPAHQSPTPPSERNSWTPARSA